MYRLYFAAVVTVLFPFGLLARAISELPVLAWWWPAWPWPGGKRP